MADVSGSTTYGYDTRNRLTSKQTPFGTLSYTYDSAGDLLSLKSSNTGGASDTYTYDQLDRLSTVTDTSGATTYSYDAVGNLQNFTYPNGVAHSYAYDTLNRLTQVGAAKAGTPQSSYAYTLGAAGNRLTVAELSGRNVAYGYDSLYRLTSETVTADPHSNNFVNGFVYDAVGNRKQWLVNGLVTNTYTYDADDRLGSDQYDADGNTTNSLGVPSSYDFENHLIQKGAVTVVYDGDGNRVAETVGGATTNYLVDTQNPTGYAQVVDELQSGTVTRTYSYGLERINENQVLNSAWTASFYGYDGHGSVRQLTNVAGAVTDGYDYDAFGNLVNSTGSTPNNYLFAGEQFDSALGLYYNRARYLNTATGRFWGMDTEEGNDDNSLSLHKYLYANADPVDGLDPSGHDDIAEMGMAMSMSMTLDAMPSAAMVGAAAVKQARFAALVQNYPSHSDYSSDPRVPGNIWALIGGYVQKNEWSLKFKDQNGQPLPNNTCAIRMSYALNLSGWTIAKGAGTVSGKDGSQYYLTVANLQGFLTRTLGSPQRLPGGTYQGPSGVSGIISFNVPWPDATGHFTLWTGQDVIDRNDEPYYRWPSPTSALFWRVN